MKPWKVYRTVLLFGGIIGLVAVMTACGSSKGASGGELSASASAPGQSVSSSASPVSAGGVLPAATPAPSSGQTAASAKPQTGAAASASTASPVSAASASAPSDGAVKPAATPAQTPAPQTPTARPAPSPEPSKEPKEQIVNVKASFFKWEPDVKTVKANTPVHFKVTSTEGIHGFSIAGTDINVQVGEGETKEVSWTPKKAGEYTIRCNVYCGDGHGTMVVTITAT